jgi:DNA-binding transcriptional ArsR family regulator
MMPTDTLSRTLSAIADPTRRAMLRRLSRGTATVTELAAPFDLSLPTISKHLKVLERAELVVRGRDAQWRPCTLRPEPLAEASEWVEHIREQWEANYARLDAVLEELKASDRKRKGS